ncbi:MAG: hypothetical protein IIX94_02155 [Clostridia bacterium]|nr:hypothetical protein [Clostridia bacterium]
MFERVISLLEQYDTIIIHRHSRPDGDAIGSQTGLLWLLKDNYPHKKIFAVGDAAGRYAFIQGEPPEDIVDEVYENALAIILDTSASALISDDRYKKAAASARIDHHIFCER